MDPEKAWEEKQRDLLVAYARAVLEREALDQRIASLRAQMGAMDYTVGLARSLASSPGPMMNGHSGTSAVADQQ